MPGRTEHEPDDGADAGAALVGMPAKRLYTIADAMWLLSLGRTAIYEQIRAGRLRTVTQGRSRLVPARALDDYIELLEREADGSADDQAA